VLTGEDVAAGSVLTLRPWDVRVLTAPADGETPTHHSDGNVR
jgi:hypothetical protein